MPTPLHPAIVHFPIVLILLGTFVALAAAITARWHLRWIAAALLAGGAIGTLLASTTGEQDGEAIEHQPHISALLDQHEDWAERTQGFSVAAGVIAIAAAAATVRSPRLARGLALASALVAVAGSFCVFQTGHYGGQLVYRHGAGVTLAAVSANHTGSQPAALAPKRAHRADDDDDDHR